MSAIDSTNKANNNSDFFQSMIKHKNPTLQRLARVGLMGSYKQIPMIEQYIDTKLKSALEPNQ